MMTGRRHGYLGHGYLGHGYLGHGGRPSVADGQGNGGRSPAQLMGVWS
jgi:hypothetical protein